MWFIIVLACSLVLNVLAFCIVSGAWKVWAVRYSRKREASQYVLEMLEEPSREVVPVISAQTYIEMFEEPSRGYKLGVVAASQRAAVDNAMLSAYNLERAAALQNVGRLGTGLFGRQPGGLLGILGLFGSLGL